MCYGIFIKYRLKYRCEPLLHECVIINKITDRRARFETDGTLGMTGKGLEFDQRHTKTHDIAQYLEKENYIESIENTGRWLQSMLPVYSALDEKRRSV